MARSALDAARFLINEMESPYVLCEIIRDSTNKPCDFKFIDFNPAFISFASLDPGDQEVISLLKSGIEAGPFLMKVLRKATPGVKNKKFEIFSEIHHKHYLITAYKPGKRILSVLFDDITASKNAEAEREAASELILSEKNARESLKKSEEKFRLLTEGSGVMISEMDSECRFLYINPAFKEILGYEPADLIGRSAFEIGNPECFCKAGKKWEEATVPGNRQENVWEFKDKSGSWHWLRCFSRTALNSSGELTITIVSIDFTEKKKAEEELQKNMRKLRSIFEILPIGIAIVDRDMNITESNPVLNIVLNSTTSELINGQYRDWKYVLKGGKVQSFQEFPKIFKSENNSIIKDIEIGLIKKDGKTIWTLINEAPLPDGNIVLSINNITAIKEKEQQLRNERENFKRIFSAAPVGLLLLDGDAVITSSNKALDWMVLRESSEVIGKRGGGGLGCIHSLENPGGCGFSKSCGDCPLSRSIEKAVSERSSFQDLIISLTLLIDSRPEKRWLSISAEPVEIDGSPMLIVAVDDITRLKTDEERIMRDEEDLNKAQELSNVGSWTFDIKNGTLSGSDEMYRLIGVQNKFPIKAEDFINDRLYPDDREQLRVTLSSLLRGKKLKPRELRIILPGRSVRTFWVQSGDPVKDEKGAFSSISGFLQDITERKLQESRLWLQALLLDSATDSILLLDTEGNIVYANQVFYETRGYTKEEIVGMNIKDIDDPESSKRISENINNIIKNGSANFEAVNLRKDGTPIYIEVSVRLINFENTKYLLSINHDITDRKLAEDGLRRREQELKTLVDNVPDIIARYDRDLRHIFINKALMNDTGIDPKSLINKRFRDLDYFPQDFIDNAENILRTIFEKGEEVNFETYIPLENGTEYYLSRGIPESGPGGKIESALVIHRNITRRKKAEEALWESEKRFESMFRSSPIATTLTRMSDNKFTDVNGVFLREFGYSREEVIGKTPYDISLWGEFKERDKMVKILKEKSKVENLETIFRSKTGKLINVILNAEILNISGTSYIFGTAIDISERKITEKKMKQSLSEKEVLLRELYHRTKNNMQVISAMLNLYSSGSQDQYLINAFMEMGNRIQSMALVHQKLYQSKNLSSISLKEYILDLVNLLSLSYNISPERITFNFDMDDIHIPVDIAIPCGLILNELVTNSLKHAFPDGRKGFVTILLKNEAGSKKNRLEVSDNGIGLPEGVDLKARAGMGIKTVIGLAEMQIKGEISYETLGGVRFSICFAE